MNCLVCPFLSFFLSFPHSSISDKSDIISYIDRRTRDKALSSLTLYFRSRTDLSALDLLKIWKGLFFCFFHSDRPLTQQALARSLSYGLVPTLPRATLHRFLRAFWITVGRDWHAIDRLRLDKYLFLVRCYVGVAFEVFLKGKMNEEGSNGDGDDAGEGRKRKRDSEGDQEDDDDKEKGRKRSKADIDTDTATNDGTKKQKQNPNQKQNGKPNKTKHSDDGQVPAKWTDLERYLSILEEGPLYPLNFDPDKPAPPPGEEPMPHGPDGLRYHIMDIWLDELEKVVEVDDQAENTNGDGGDDDDDDDDESQGGSTLKPRLKGDVPMSLLLRPFRKLKERSPTKTVRVRAGEVLDDERLVKWGFKQPKRDSDDEDDDDDEDDEDDGSEEEEEEWGGFDD